MISRIWCECQKTILTFGINFRNCDLRKKISNVDTNLGFRVENREISKLGFRVWNIKIRIWGLEIQN